MASAAAQQRLGPRRPEIVSRLHLGTNGVNDALQPKRKEEIDDLAIPEEEELAVPAAAVSGRSLQRIASHQLNAVADDDLRFKCSQLCLRMFSM